MKLFQKCKDGGPTSHVDAYVLIEWKRAFSIMLLHFAPGSREAYHDHAFNAVSWIFKGRLDEFVMVDGLVKEIILIKPSLFPVFTGRSRLHKVVSKSHTWALTFRGPWAETWNEYHPGPKKFVALTHGREEV